VHALVAVLAVTALTAGLSLPQAVADDLDDQKARIEKQIQQSKKDLNESSKDLNDKAAALQASQVKLSDAQAKLAQTQAELAKADALDKQMAAKLVDAQAKLAAAAKAVAEGVVKLDEERTQARTVVQQQWQQRTNLLPVAVLAQAGSTRDFQTRLQWSTTMFDASEARIAALETAQRDLNAKRQAQSALEIQVAADRKAAAENLKTKQALEAQAQQQANEVAALVKANEEAKAAAQQAAAEDQKQYEKLVADRVAVEGRIKARIAAQKKAAAEKAAAEAAARKKARNKQSQSNSGSSRGSGGRSDSGGAHHGFIFPVNGPITSPYGMRLHPVTHVWKLHDGTDFGVGCGTPIRAAYSGVVEERYFNVAWGNRLIIDHGKVDGHYVSTAYNHATRYVVGVGQHVSKGQVIGYVGTTGYSTGCHLHLNLYLDGNVSNPMSWY